MKIARCPCTVVVRDPPNVDSLTECDRMCHVHDELHVALLPLQRIHVRTKKSRRNPLFLHSKFKCIVMFKPNLITFIIHFHCRHTLRCTAIPDLITFLRNAFATLISILVLEKLLMAHISSNYLHGSTLGVSLF